MNILEDPKEPRPDNDGVYVVGLVYDVMDSTIEIQALRDLILLSADMDIKVNDYGRKIEPELLQEAGLETTDAQPVLNIVYKVGDEWPYYDPDIQIVKRDLQAKDCAPRLDPRPRPGYFLREQGRPGANLTELYLNRTAPRGNGLSDALVVLLWGT